VRVSRTRHGLTRFANSFIHQHVGEDTVSIGLTIAVDGRTATAATTDTRDDALRDLVEATIASASLQPVDPYWPGRPRRSRSPRRATSTRPPRWPNPASAPSSCDLRGRRPDLRAAGYLDTEGTWSAFASTAGQRASGRTSRATIDGIHQTDTSAGSAHQTSVRLADLDAVVVGERAADRARRSADFTDLDPGEYEVVLGNEAVSTILTFLAFYGFNAKQHLEGQSFAVLGEQQFDPASRSTRTRPTRGPSPCRSTTRAPPSAGSRWCRRA
jgi:predicted Zn-dependent protease